MHDLIPFSLSTLLPLPKIDIHIRPAVMGDIPFMDKLQKLHTKQVGWMPTAQFEGKIRAGHVLIAEEKFEVEGLEFGVEDEDISSTPNSKLLTPNCSAPLGYCIGNDQYFKRDDVGIIYQMNVLPGRQRGLIGATLLQAMFDRAAYGCRLFCCWCAQDIAANKFWEAMGFVPLAFRAGSEKKSRVHIFWQKRIRAGDTTTPWWFPSKTAGGSIREDRIVLPIPPGTHWSDAKPLVLPSSNPPALQDDQVGHAIACRERESAAKKRKTARNSVPYEKPTPANVQAVSLGGLRFAPVAPPAVVKEKPKRETKPKQKSDPRLVAAARELRDRWLEQVNTFDGASPVTPLAKYEVSRAIESGTVAIEENPPRLLDAA